MPKKDTHKTSKVKNHSDNKTILKTLKTTQTAYLFLRKHVHFHKFQNVICTKTYFSNTQTYMPPIHATKTVINNNFFIYREYWHSRICLLLTLVFFSGQNH